jgi:N-acetylmuramoyl-L-alanine amidase
MSDSLPKMKAVGPAGKGQRIVEQGESIQSIAVETGHVWQTIWDHPDNEDLRAQRGNPALLLPGDRVAIPPIRPKHVSISTGQEHRFVRAGTMTRFRLRLYDEDGQPRRNERYVLEVGRHRYENESNADGEVDEMIPCTASMATVTLVETEEVYELQLGHLDPADTVTGAQARMNNLGFTCGAVDGDVGPRTEEAWHAFREDAFGDEEPDDDEVQQRLASTDPWRS